MSMLLYRYKHSNLSFTVAVSTAAFFYPVVRLSLTAFANCSCIPSCSCILFSSCNPNCIGFVSCAAPCDQCCFCIFPICSCILSSCYCFLVTQAATVSSPAAHVSYAVLLTCVLWMIFFYCRTLMPDYVHIIFILSSSIVSCFSGTMLTCCSMRSNLLNQTG